MKVFTGMASKKGPSKSNEETDQNNNSLSLLYNMDAPQVGDRLRPDTSDRQDCSPSLPADIRTIQKEFASAGTEESEAATPTSQQCDRLTAVGASCGSHESLSTNSPPATEAKECLHIVLGNVGVQSNVIHDDDEDDELDVDDKFESCSSISSGSQFQSTDSLFTDSGFNSSTGGDDKDDSLRTLLEIRNIPHHDSDSDDINSRLEDGLSDYVNDSSSRKSSSDSGISTSSEKDSDIVLSESDIASSQSDVDISSWDASEAIENLVHPNIVNRHTSIANINLDSRVTSRRNFGRRRRAASGAVTNNNSDSGVPNRPILGVMRRRLMVKDTNNNLAAGRKIRSFLPSFKNRLVDGCHNNGILGLFACIVYGLLLVFVCTFCGVLFEAGKSVMRRDLRELRSNVINNRQQRRTGTSLG